MNSLNRTSVNHANVNFRSYGNYELAIQKMQSELRASFEYAMKSKDNFPFSACKNFGKFNFLA